MNFHRVLVTGGCGYIGSHVVRQLSEAGYQVTVLDNLSTGVPEALIHDEELVIGDVGDEPVLEALFSQRRFRSVLHFAGSVTVPESVAKPLQYYENNTSNTLKLLKVCTAFDTEGFVFSSTASVYGDNLEASLPETYPLNPTNPYSRSKWMSERILDDVGRGSSLRYVVLRYFNVAGADPQARMGQRSPEATHLIKVGCEVLTGKRRELYVFGEDYPTPDGTGIRDYIHVEDLASAHLSALRYLEGGGSSVTLNCGYGKGLSVLEVLEGLKRVGGEFPVQRAPRRPGDVPSLIADVRKIHRTLDWEPRYDDLDEIVRSALAWERRLSRSHAQGHPH